MMGHQMPAQGMGQQQMTQGGGMPGGMAHDSAAGCGMMGATTASPEHLLEMKADLRLTADQERRVTALRDAARTVHDAGMRDAEGSQRELDQVMRAAAPDAALLRRHFEAAHAAMGRAHLAMLQATAQARAVLTDAQRRQVDSMHATMGQPQPQQPAHRH
jgi:Spy/CpxP family protein refolding chaperone